MKEEGLRGGRHSVSRIRAVREEKRRRRQAEEGASDGGI